MNNLTLFPRSSHFLPILFLVAVTSHISAQSFNKTYDIPPSRSFYANEIRNSFSVAGHESIGFIGNAMAIPRFTLETDMVEELPLMKTSETGKLPCDSTAAGFYKTYWSYGSPAVDVTPNSEGYSLLIKGGNSLFVDVQTDHQGNGLSEEFNTLTNVGGMQTKRVSDGHYLIADIAPLGIIFMIKKTIAGDTLWAHEYTVPNPAKLPKNIRLAENGAGELFINGVANTGQFGAVEEEFFSLKLSPDGQQIWAKSYLAGGQLWAYLGLGGIETTPEGGLIMLGVFSSLEDKYVLLRVDGDGNEMFNQSTNLAPDEGVSCLLDYGDNERTVVFIRGLASVNTSPSRVVIFSSTGSVIIDKLIPSSPAISHAVRTDDGFVGVGIVPGAFYMAGFDSTATLIWDKQDFGFIDQAFFLKKDLDGGFLTGGWDYNQPMMSNFAWLLKTDGNGNVAPQPESEISATICEGGIFDIENQEFTTAGNHIIVLSDQNGCDSLVELHLAVLPSDSIFQNAIICEGESFVFENEELTTGGIYTHVFENQNGCDSLRQLTLKVLPHDTIQLPPIDLCIGEPSPLTGNIYTDPTTVFEEIFFQNHNGCDSTLIAEVTVHPNVFIEVDTQVPYNTIYNSFLLTQDTQFVTLDTTAFGCPLEIREHIMVGPNAVNGLEKLIVVEVFPNPVSGRLSVVLELPESMVLDMKVYDALGREVGVLFLEKRFSAGGHVLYFETLEWPVGVLFLKIQAVNGSVFKKLIKG